MKRFLPFVFFVCFVVSPLEAQITLVDNPASPWSQRWTSRRGGRPGAGNPGPGVGWACGDPLEERKMGEWSR